MHARCLPPAVIAHAHVPSGPTAMLTSTGSSPESLAVITMKLSLFTPTLSMPSPNAEQKKRMIRSACLAAGTVDRRWDFDQLLP